MPGIVCPIRGGPASQSTISHAIALAQREQQVLTFLYVVNLDFLTRTMTSRVAFVQEEMRQLGEFILLMALTVAGAAGIEARKEVREGKVAEQIAALCRELDADYVVVGATHPAQDPTQSGDLLTALEVSLRPACAAKLVIVP